MKFDFINVWAEEMKAVFKDEGVLMFVLVVPLFYPLLYSWVYTNEVVREVPVAVVDMSHSNMSRQFIRKFDASPDTKVAFHCNNLDEAKDLTGRQKAYGILYFPSDFQSCINRMEQGHVSIFCDMSFMLYYKGIFQTATNVAGSMNANIQIERAGNKTDREDEITTTPLAFDEVQMFNTTGGYGNFIIPGVLMLIIQQTLLLGIGMSAGTRREKMAALSAPDNRHKAGIMSEISGKALCFFMIFAVMAAYNTLAVPHIFKFTSMLHATDMLMFMLPYLMACIFFAMTVSFAVRYREDVMLIVVFSSVPMLFLSGVSWPQSSIPEFWQWVSSLIPSTFGIRGFVRMNTMGAGLGDVMPEYKALWIQTAVYFAITILLYARRNKKEKLVKQA